ncbi:MAG: phosphoribosylglycinamide formyltransferase [Candidatus Diapherotrites archaeon]|uniref:phosphoribosylglycinamide formyltransferase 1 n=1 Tax=Candidatus Iainarchaeum sp. TaxID=3101447 RepID=A0A2D6M189_9ARCH|nr:phosphoribosylglycinamide formyltransferase [Candidatus Diapherotrites archaeon]|tara:strand:- start:967 stop:1584 length:618 start_codon:yes stop_codon:yes gene_type:complete
MEKIVLGVLASTNATDLQAVIDAIQAKKLPAEIACLISNKEKAFALKRAEKHGIESIFLDPNDFSSTEEYDSKLVQLLTEHKVDLVLLIGYNKVLSKPFVEAFQEKAMNIHPSLLPAFKGWYKSVYEDVFDYGCKVTGCTLFFISDEPDAGPIIAQKAVDIAENETFDSIKEKVQKAEQEIIIKAVKLFCEDKLKVEGNKVRVLE